MFFVRIANKPHVTKRLEVLGVSSLPFQQISLTGLAECAKRFDPNHSELFRAWGRLIARPWFDFRLLGYWTLLPETFSAGTMEGYNANNGSLFGP